jgi:hypothetical protein
VRGAGCSSTTGSSSGGWAVGSSVDISTLTP